MRALLPAAYGTSIRPRRRARQRAASLAGILVAIVGVLAGETTVAEWRGRSIDLMGTRVSVELWHVDAAAGDALVEQVFDEYRRIDRNMSTYRPDSEISRINDEAGRQAVTVGDELLQLIGRALELSALSGGAFDISYESVGYLYDFRARRHPDEAQIEAGLPAVGYRQIVLAPEAHTIRFASPGMRINLGGIAKGYAVERGAAMLRAAGVQHALLNAGGDTRVLGDRRGQAWIVGIRHPRAEDAVVTRLPLVDEAISTSGDYERFFEEDGRRYHHILNPDTGRPAEGMLSATVIGPDATMTDGLSTTLFVLGADAGLALIERLPDYEAIVVDSRGTLRYSNGLVAPE